MAELGAAAQALLTLVLLAAGISKLRDLDSFRSTLRAYEWLPNGSSGPLSLAVPILECVTAIGLWFEPTRRPAAAVAFGMLVLFTILIARLVLAGGDVWCGCFGSASQKVTWFSVGRNLILVLGAAIVVVTETTKESLPAMLTGAGVALLIVVVDVATSALSTTRRA